MGADDRLPRLEDFRHPKDMARWAFWVPLRDYLDPHHPRRLRSLFPLWHLQYRAGGGQRRRMRDEYRRSFPELDERGLERLVREAYRVAFRVHLEELLMGRLDAETVDDFLELRGEAHLLRALERGRGAIVLSAHAGSFMLPIAWFSLKGYPYSQYAARGLPPREVAEAHPEALPVNWWLARAREARESNEDRLPARFLTLRDSARELYRRLARNELVGIAFDGRIGNRWVRAPLLGREALLNPGAYRLAERTGAAIVPTFCHTPRRGRSVCELGEPLYPDGQPWPVLMRRFLAEHADPFLRRHPEEYGTWLAHCRLRNAIDDHPLFADHAVDERWKRHPRLEELL